MSDAVADVRLDRLESDVREIKTDVRDMNAALARVELVLGRMDERLNATLPHLATKAELANVRVELGTALADKPSKGFIVGLIALLTALYALGLAGLAALPMLRGLWHG